MGPRSVSEPVSLNQQSLSLLRERGLAVPEYDRSTVRVGVVHIGVGGFHRAHQAMYLDRLLNDGRAGRWGICGLGVLPGDVRMRDALAAQDYLYTLVVKHPSGDWDGRVIGSIVDFVHAPDDPMAAVHRLADADVGMVSLTITEGGYAIDRSTGGLDETAPGIRHDLSVVGATDGAGPSTVFGLIVEALAQRRQRSVAPFTVVSCDNIPGNGDLARRQVTAFARLRDAELADWIDAEVAFPNSMVDRITPVTTDADRIRIRARWDLDDEVPVVCEPYEQWALEDRFVGGRTGRPELERVGVQMVDDVEPFEKMKLRLLNSSHQALCYLGYLSGYRFAHEVAQDPTFARFLLRYMDEASPTLDPVPGMDIAAYKHQLVERFANPEVQDTLARLCAESSDRIPPWLLPVIGDNLSAGRDVEAAALVVAGWARYAEGVDEAGEPIDVVDRRRDQVMAAAAQQREDPLAFVRNRELFGDLADQPAFAEAFTRALASLHERGAQATVAASTSGDTHG